MRLLIIRHAEPNYDKGCLTPKGRREAQLLADRLCKLDIKEFYTSPLQRAQETIAPTLKRLGRTTQTCEWLREFEPEVARPDLQGGRHVAWDWLPEDWTKREKFFDRNQWWEDPLFEDAHYPSGEPRSIRDEYAWVTGELDALLAKHGYVRDGNFYRAEQRNRDTIVFTCHYGLECVLLSHLINVSPMILWHGFVATTSSVTTIYTEERRDGKAYFRINAFGDISHLYVADEAPSFKARFCETYDCETERRD